VRERREEADRMKKEAAIPAAGIFLGIVRESQSIISILKTVFACPKISTDRPYTPFLVRRFVSTVVLHSCIYLFIFFKIVTNLHSLFIYK